MKEYKLILDNITTVADLKIDDKWNIKHPILKHWLYEMVLINNELPELEIKIVHATPKLDGGFEIPKYDVFYKGIRVFYKYNMLLANVKQEARKIYQKEIK